MPTTGDADPGASLDVFIASCRLSVILDRLLPILGCDGGQDLDHRVIVHGAAKELDTLDRNVTLRHGEPGTCEYLEIVEQDAIFLNVVGSYRLDFLGVQVLICRIGLDEAGPLSLQQLQKVATNVLSIAENLVDFLDTLTGVDYTAFWAPCTFTLDECIQDGRALTTVHRVLLPYITYRLSSPTDLYQATTSRPDKGTAARNFGYSLPTPQKAGVNLSETISRNLGSGRSLPSQASTLDTVHPGDGDE